MLFFKLVRAPGNDSIDDTGRSNRVRSPAGGVSAVAAAESSATVIAVDAADADFAPDVHQHSGALADSVGISLNRGFTI